MKKFIAIVLALVLVFSFAACGNKETATETTQTIKIAVPNDTTNESRALKLLEVQGLITLNDTEDELATVLDIAENPYNIEFLEVEAAQIPSVLADVTYAVINSNYAIEAGLTPFVTEGTDVSYPNVICVKEDNVDADLTKALVAAINSTAVESYINDTYKGAIVCDLVGAGDGKAEGVDYAALAGQTISIAASPTPHAGILAVAKEVLAENGITLDIIEYTDYVQPNNVVESGDCYANYFAHIPYQENFNAENGTHIAWVLEVHHEPMGIYSATYTDLSAIK